jgi:membrane protein involved in colicin uptake
MTTGSTGPGNTASAVAASAAADKAASDKSAALEGATSVAHAVQQVADAAVAAIGKTKSDAPGDFIITGSKGGGFTIRGDGFSSGGTVKFGGAQALTVEWGGQLIRGKVPEGINVPCDVTVSVDEKTVKRGYFRG